MTVTDEMIEVAAAALWDEPYSTQKVRAALTAAYPLIRAQVLEEAAKVCGEYAEIENHSHNESGSHAACYAASTIRDIEQAIRDMKGDV